MLVLSGHLAKRTRRILSSNPFPSWTQWSWRSFTTFMVLWFYKSCSNWCSSVPCSENHLPGLPGDGVRIFMWDYLRCISGAMGRISSPLEPLGTDLGGLFLLPPQPWFKKNLIRGTASSEEEEVPLPGAQFLCCVSQRNLLMKHDANIPPRGQVP